MLQDPSIDVIVYFVCTEEADYLLGGVLVAVYLPGVYLDAQVDKEPLVILMNRLVTLGVGLLYHPEDVRVLHNPVVDVQQQGLALDGVQLGYHALHLDVLQNLLG